MAVARPQDPRPLQVETTRTVSQVVRYPLAGARPTPSARSQARFVGVELDLPSRDGIKTNAEKARLTSLRAGIMGPLQDLRQLQVVTTNAAYQLGHPLVGARPMPPARSQETLFPG